jgi:hypothetical protein
VVTLAQGGTLTAKVTADTEIECDDSTAKAASDGPGDDNEGDDDQGDDNQGDGNHGDGDHGDHGDDGGAPCGAEALTQGRQVKEGELKTSGGAAVWEKVELGT